MMDFSELLIGEDAALTEAMQALNRTACKVLFVVREGRLVGAVTDGDIRRYILEKGSVEGCVRAFANYNPKYLTPDGVKDADAFMCRYDITVAPVVDEDGRVIDVLFQNGPKPFKPAQRFTAPVVVNAGGKGTRLYPYTKILPKPLIPIGEVPVAEHILNRFHAMGCADFYMILNEKRNMIKAYFGEVDKPYSLTFIDEQTPLGTGGGLSLLKGRLRETFVFANCDTLIDEDFSKILREHKRSGNLITMIAALKHFDIPYGVIETGENGSITGFSEKPQLSFLVNTGCYIVEPQVVEAMRPGEAVSFPTVVERCRQQGRPVGIYPIGEQAWLDMGQFDAMADMKRRLEET